MGQSHVTTAAIERRDLFRLRRCLCQGCEHDFRPTRWNQRYCGQVDCQLRVRRWLARKRQRRCRVSEVQRARHRDRERVRRARQREQPRPQPAPGNTEPDLASAPDPPTRGHARAQISEPFCDRPGCYDPVAFSPRKRARYCGAACRTVMRRVLGRERKWLRRKTAAGRFKRQLEYQLARTQRISPDETRSPLRE